MGWTTPILYSILVVGSFSCTHGSLLADDESPQGAENAGGVSPDGQPSNAVGPTKFPVQLPPYGNYPFYPVNGAQSPIFGKPVGGVPTYPGGIPQYPGAATPLSNEGVNGYTGSVPHYARSGVLPYNGGAPWYPGLGPRYPGEGGTAGGYPYSSGVPMYPGGVPQYPGGEGVSPNNDEFPPYRGGAPQYPEEAFQERGIYSIAVPAVYGTMHIYPNTAGVVTNSPPPCPSIVICCLMPVFSSCRHPNVGPDTHFMGQQPTPFVNTAFTHIRNHQIYPPPDPNTFGNALESPDPLNPQNDPRSRVKPIMFGNLVKPFMPIAPHPFRFLVLKPNPTPGICLGTGHARSASNFPGLLSSYGIVPHSPHPAELQPNTRGAVIPISYSPGLALPYSNGFAPSNMNGVASPYSPPFLQKSRASPFFSPHLMLPTFHSMLPYMTNPNQGYPLQASSSPYPVNYGGPYQRTQSDFLPPNNFLNATKSLL